MTVHEKAELIIKDIKLENGTNPVHIFKKIARKEYISIHGPEHHILDGASLLVAYKNAGGNIDIDNALEKLMSEGLRMPGAMCGLWGICGHNKISAFSNLPGTSTGCFCSKYSIAVSFRI